MCVAFSFLILNLSEFVVIAANIVLSGLPQISVQKDATAREREREDLLQHVV